MKYYRLIGLVVGLIIFNLQLSSGQQAVEDKIDTYRIGFFTEKLQLTPQESKDFWPVYNLYKEKLKALKKQNVNRPRQVVLMNDSELESFLGDLVQQKEDEARIFKEMNEELKKVLPTRKVVLLYYVEKEFNTKLLQSIRKNNPRGND